MGQSVYFWTFNWITEWLFWFTSINQPGKALEYWASLRTTWFLSFFFFYQHHLFLIPSPSTQSHPPWVYLNELCFSISSPSLVGCVSSVLLIQSVLIQRQSSRVKLHSNWSSLMVSRFNRPAITKWLFNSVEQNTLLPQCSMSFPMRMIMKRSFLLSNCSKYLIMPILKANVSYVNPNTINGPI